jgi:hypothetical protein
MKVHSTSFADRDSFMRHLYGMGIGHSQSLDHNSAPSSSRLHNALSNAHLPKPACGARKASGAMDIFGQLREDLEAHDDDQNKGLGTSFQETQTTDISEFESDTDDGDLNELEELETYRMYFEC